MPNQRFHDDRERLVIIAILVLTALVTIVVTHSWHPGVDICSHFSDTVSGDTGRLARPCLVKLSSWHDSMKGMVESEVPRSILSGRSIIVTFTPPSTNPHGSLNSGYMIGYTKRRCDGQVDRHSGVLWLCNAGAGDGTRTRTGLPPTVFKTAASAIPPLRHWFYYTASMQDV